MITEKKEQFSVFDSSGNDDDDGSNRESIPRHSMFDSSGMDYGYDTSKISATDIDDVTLGIPSFLDYSVNDRSDDVTFGIPTVLDYSFQNRSGDVTFGISTVLNYSFNNRSDDVTSHWNQSESGVPPYWNIPTRAAFAAALIAMMLFAMVGNLLVITVVWKNRGMRTRTNMFLCNLALADLLCACLDMPFSLVTMIHGDWIFTSPGFVCRLNGFLTEFFFVSSIHTLMYISIHKWFTITRPFKMGMTRRHVVLMISLAWLWATLVASFGAGGLADIQYKPFTTQCGPKYPSDLKSYSMLTSVLVTCYTLPLVVILFCTVQMVSTVRAHGSRMLANTTADQQHVADQQKHILVTLAIVVVMFVLTWTPWVAYLIYAVKVTDANSVNPLANPITYWFGYLNSTCNPIIYAFRSQAFRNGYQEIIAKLFRFWRGEQSSEVDIPNGKFLTNHSNSETITEFSSLTNCSTAEAANKKMPICCFRVSQEQLDSNANCDTMREVIVDDLKPAGKILDFKGSSSERNGINEIFSVQICQENSETVTTICKPVPDQNRVDGEYWTQIKTRPIETCFDCSVFPFLCFCLNREKLERSSNNEEDGELPSPGVWDVHGRKTSSLEIVNKLGGEIRDSHMEKCSKLTHHQVQHNNNIVEASGGVVHRCASLRGMYFRYPSTEHLDSEKYRQRSESELPSRRKRKSKRENETRSVVEGKRRSQQIKKERFSEMKSRKFEKRNSIPTKQLKFRSSLPSLVNQRLYSDGKNLCTSSLPTNLNDDGKNPTSI